MAASSTAEAQARALIHFVSAIGAPASSAAGSCLRFRLLAAWLPVLVSEAYCRYTLGMSDSESDDNIEGALPLMERFTLFFDFLGTCGWRNISQAAIGV